MSEEDKVDPRLNFINNKLFVKAEDREDKFEERVVRLILGACKVPGHVITGFKEADALTLEAIGEYTTDMPAHLVLCGNLREEIGTLFTSLPKSQVWGEFFRVRSNFTEHEHPYVGLVFTSGRGTSAYVIHDWWGGEQSRGFTRLSRLSADGSKMIVVEPFESFLSYIKPV